MNWRTKNCWHLFFAPIIVCLAFATGLRAQSENGQIVDGEIEFVGSLSGANASSFQVASDDSLPQQAVNAIELSTSTDLKTPPLRPVPKSRQPIAQPPTGVLYQWESSSDIQSQRLFEDPLLERHGISRNVRLQPAYSGIRFFKDGFLFPAHLILRKHRRAPGSKAWGRPSL